MISPRLLQAHRWAALGLGAVIVVIGLTAASLVFRDELAAWFTPAIHVDLAPPTTTPNGMNRIYIDAASATVLRASLLERLPPGNAMFEWLYPLHTGKLLGKPYRVFLVFAGLVPLLSLVTGLIVWRSRASPRRTVAHDSVRASNTA